MQAPGRGHPSPLRTGFSRLLTSHRDRASFSKGLGSHHGPTSSSHSHFPKATRQTPPQWVLGPQHAGWGTHAFRPQREFPPSLGLSSRGHLRPAPLTDRGLPRPGPAASSPHTGAGLPAGLRAAAPVTALKDRPGRPSTAGGTAGRGAAGLRLATPLHLPAQQGLAALVPVLRAAGAALLGRPLAPQNLGRGVRIPAGELSLLEHPARL